MSHCAVYLSLDPRETRLRFSAARAWSTSVLAWSRARSGCAPAVRLSASEEDADRPPASSQTVAASIALVAATSPGLNTRLVRRSSSTWWRSSAASVSTARANAAHGTDPASS